MQCTVIAMNVRVSFGMYMMSDFCAPQLWWYSIHQYSMSQSLLPPNLCTTLLEFAEDLLEILAGVIHSVCGWSHSQTAAASKPHPLRVVDTHSCTHQCCRRRWWLLIASTEATSVVCMSWRVAEGNRLSTYERKAFAYQNDSLPDSDTTPDEAQQNQGIDKSASRG